MRPITNRSARDIQDTDQMLVSDISSQEYMYKMGDIAGYILKSISTSEDFTSQTSVTVTHNRGYHPTVWVEDTNGIKINFTLTYSSDLAFVVGPFTSARSGSIHYL